MSSKTTTTTTTTTTTRKWTVPVQQKDCGYFDSQKNNFSNWITKFDDSYKDTDINTAEKKFDLQLQKVRGDLFKVDSGSGSLQVENPFVTDASGKQKLTLRYDVSKYKPEEITVTTADNRLGVHAKHVEEAPGKTIRSEFTREYILPDNVDPKLVTSTLTADGVLLIEAPVKTAIEAPKENLVPIEHL